MSRLAFTTVCLLLFLCQVAIAQPIASPTGPPANPRTGSPGAEEQEPEHTGGARRDNIDPFLKYAQNVDVRVGQVDLNDFPTVRLFVSATEENGILIKTLKAEDFEVEENGIPATDVDFSNRDILNLPLSIVFVVDISGSMSAKLDEFETNPLDLEIEAIKQFVTQLNPRDRVGLIAFSDAAIREVDLTTDHQQLIRRLERLSAWGQTTLWDGVYAGMQELLADPEPARRALIVLSDGLDNKSLENPQTVISFYDTEAAANNMGFSVYALGLGQEIDRGGLGSIATKTGGLYMDSPRAEDLADLYQDILNQIQSEYILEYTSPGETVPGQIIDVKAGLNVVDSFSPGKYTYRSPGLAKALSRTMWPGLAVIAILLAILVIATIFKLARQAWLIVKITPLEGKDYALGEMGLNIGTSELCEIRLPHDPAILPMHAAISQTTDGFVLEAADSDSPIFAGGQVLVRKLLRTGDKFKLGHTEFVFNEKINRPGAAMDLDQELLAAGKPLITEESQSAAGKGNQPRPADDPRLLAGIGGALEGKVFELKGGDNSAGRGDDRDISLTGDSQASRNHCVISLIDGQVHINDSGSTNGTFVNGKQCQPGMAQRLYVGDRVKIGSSEFRME